MVIIVGLLHKWAGNLFPLSIEDILYDLVDINGHAQGRADTVVVERFSPHVIADVGVTKGWS